MNGSRISINFNQDAPKLEEQLNLQGFTLGKWEKALERERISIILLERGGLLTPPQYRRICEKLFIKIQNTIKEYEAK